MAFNQVEVSDDQVRMVEMVTGFGDHSMIQTALQGNHGQVDTVVNEILDDREKFKRKYGWDESAFSSGRDGEDTTNTRPTGEAFSIHQQPPIIYGTEPNNYYGAPSRPPSRANNRSPMSRLADMASGEYGTAAPSNRQEEEDQIQRAINESLTASGIQTPHAFPPPPPPTQQQSGVITNNGESSVHFGPANRPDYEPDEWAMVRLGKQESDPDPTLRAKKDGMPVLLRCRKEHEWEKHRVGALLMIFGQIPAARNVLLESGVAPGYGYGSKNDWWRGEPITLPVQPNPNPDGWMDEPVISWSDELHRLMAFLELTERAYGTADSLTRARHPDAQETGDAEKDFFQNFAEAGAGEGNREKRETLISSVEIVSLDNFSPQGGDRFGLLDLLVSKETDPMPKNIYHVLDWLFFADLRLAREDLGATRMAWINQAADVFTCRFQKDDELPVPLEIPETFYLDRYMKTNGEKLQELQVEMVALLKAYDANMQREEELIKWVNRQTNKAYDRRVLIKAAVDRYQENVRKIKRRAFWRKHEQTPAEGEGAYYLPDRAGEPSLLPAESEAVSYYEAKIRKLEDRLAEMQRLINDVIIPEREAIHEVNRKMSSLLTVPSTDEKWNPTHKYTLCGVVNDLNTVYQWMHVPASEAGAAPAGDAPAAGEKRWWKTSFKPADNTVEHTQVTYETVMRETCSVKCKPIIVYATDKALEQDNLPLPDALKTFARLDNRLFKQELLQSNRPGHKRSAGVGDGSQSKRLQRSASIDSMDTNHASAGDFDDDMRDAPFDNDSIFGVAGAGDATPNRAARATQDASIPDLVDAVGETPGLTATMTSPPSYENYIEMETGVSPALAQVSLQDLKNLSPPKPQEMQERPNAQLLTRISSNANNNGGAAIANGNPGSGSAPTVVRDEEEPLIDLSDPQDADPKTQANGV